MTEELVDLETDDDEYIAQVGERLRSIRRQKRMSLLDVEAASGKEFKASVLGAYERGERAISVPRLQRLASLYAVPVAQLLPAPDETSDGDDRSLGVPFGARTAMTIDLDRGRPLMLKVFLVTNKRESIVRKILFSSLDPVDEVVARVNDKFALKGNEGRAVTVSCAGRVTVT